MALRFRSGYSSLQLIDPMFSTLDERQPYLLEDVPSVWNDYLNPVYSSDPLPFPIEQDEYFYQENNTFMSPNYFPDLSYFRPPEISPQEGELLPGCYYQELPHTKRPRTMYGCLPADETMLVNYEDAPFGNPLLIPELWPASSSPGLVTVSQITRQNMEVETAALSPQSVAARQRRKKISEKTQELGRLIPGGTKMNTAEMLASAAKYVKFLQAQVRVLEFLGNSTAPQRDIEDLSSNLQLHQLLSSLTMQEKLYEAEKCIMPLKNLLKHRGPATDLCGTVSLMMWEREHFSLSGTNKIGARMAWFLA